MKTFEEWRNWDQEKLDLMCSPSRFNKRLTADEVVMAHRAAVEKGYDEIINLLPVKKDISYGLSEGQKMDIFNEQTSKGTPVLVYFHGGYWSMMSKKQGYFIVANPVREAGCTVILVEYDLCPKVSLGEIVNQVQTAAKGILETAKIQGSSGVYFAGHSAGAHLTVMIATSPWLQDDSESQKLIKGYFAISGLFDLRLLVKSYVNESLKMTEEDAIDNSPVFKLETISKNVAANCPFLLILGENDSPEYIRQSEHFHQALAEFRLQSRVLMIPNVDHFNLMENLVNKDYILTQEILKLIKSAN